jgi:CRP-like cAMP-binding protein
VARQILALADRYGNLEAGGEVVIPLRLTQSDLGEIVGASRERVNQVIGDFKQRGTIAVEGDHRIRVRNRRDLARFCR